MLLRYGSFFNPMELDEWYPPSLSSDIQAQPSVLDLIRKKKTFNAPLSSSDTFKKGYSKRKDEHFIHLYNIYITDTSKFP